MANSSGNDASFDPRSWIRQGAGQDPGSHKGDARTTPHDKQDGKQGDKPAGTLRDTASFDPKAWNVESPAAIAPEKAGRARNGALVLALGAFAAIALAAAGAIYLRPGSPPASGDPAAALTAPAAAPASPSAHARNGVPGTGLRSLKLASSSEVAPTLQQAGVDKAIAAQVAARVARVIAPGRELDFEFGLNASAPDEPASLAFAQASLADGSGVRIAVGAQGLREQAIKASLTRKVTTVRGELDGDSFYTSAVSAGVVDSLISDFANAFTFDFNLAHEVNAGDVFEVAFAEQINPRGERVGKPELLYVSLTTPTKSKNLYRFKAPGEKDYGWFDANGTSTVRSFMRTPIDGARITSKFGMRFHPVLKYTRLHGGTDFAAPVGTPIYAAADATVLSASPSACAGNMVVLAHDKSYQTRYFHLSRYADGLHSGQHVRQGETIGYVGNTGTCTTGPHLHYEVHIGNQKIDPLSVDTGEAKTLSSQPLSAFYKVRDDIDRARAAH